MKCSRFCSLLSNGIYNCRWKPRENVSKTKLREKFWWWFFLLVFLFVVSSLFCWSVFSNDYNDIEWFIYNKIGIFFVWGTLVLSVFVIMVFYLLILFATGVTLIAKMQARSLHLCHKILLFPILIISIVGYALLSQLFPVQFNVAHMAWQMMGPFLHLVMLIVLTSASWLMFYEIMQIQHKKLWIIANVGMYSLMIFICLLPLTIRSPCIRDSMEDVPKPPLLSHRGYKKTTPENTQLSFEIAGSSCDLFGFESDVRISLDGVPFLMHDETLIRTTNVRDVFSNRSEDRSEMFTWDELQQLDAGSWFLEQDPYRTARFLTENEKEKIRKQKIPSLADLADIAERQNHSILFDLLEPPLDHPHYNDSWIITAQTLLSSGLRHDLVLWLPWANRSAVQRIAPGFRFVSNTTQIDELLSENVEIVNLRYQAQTTENVHLYLRNNISVLQFTISTPWLFSLVWCQETTYVTSGDCKNLENMDKPIWNLTSGEYLAMWICLDFIAVAVFTTIYIAQYKRYQAASNFQDPGIIMTNAGVRNLAYS